MSLKWNNPNRNNTFGFKPDQIDPTDNRFHSIYFIDSLSGAVLTSKKYSDTLTETNDDLISGFLNAINLFIREIKKDREEIQEINFNDSRIIYDRKGRLIAVGITRKTNLPIERSILHQVLNDFYFRFETQINKFNGVIAPEILDYKIRLKNMNLHGTFNHEFRS